LIAAEFGDYAVKKSGELFLNIWVIIIELLIALSIGAISSFWAKGIESFIIGLFSFFVIELVQVRLNIIKTNGVISSISSYLNNLNPCDTFSELFLIYGLRALSKVTKDTVYVERDYIWDFWRDCISRCRNKWSVLTYTKADETWDLGWGSTIALTIQKERIQNGCSIERIFIYDTEDEIEKLNKTMRMQRKIGIEVYYLKKREFVKNDLVKEYLKSEETLDIGISDDTWVYRTHLDKRRKMVSASASKSEGLKQKAQFLIREAKKIAEKYNEP